MSHRMVVRPRDDHFVHGFASLGDFGGEHLLGVDLDVRRRATEAG